MIEIEIECNTGIAPVRRHEQTSRFRHDRMSIDEAVDRAMQRDGRCNVGLESDAYLSPVKISEQSPDGARVGMRREQEMRDVIQRTLSESARDGRDFFGLET